MEMISMEKVIKGLEFCKLREFSCNGCPYYKDEFQRTVGECLWCRIDEAIALLKEHKNEYENGFNDAMLGKQELMYEGTDGKWHKKDW